MRQIVEFPCARRSPSALAKDATVTNPEIAVIVNPGAAGGKALKALPVINDTLKGSGTPYAIYVTKARGDAIDAARNHAEAGASRILAVGGDGTINEVANGIYQSGVDAMLGLVPVGHGTDLARYLGTSKDIAEAVRHACAGDPRQVDLGLACYADGTERAFINIAGLGFDAMVASKAQKSRLPGGNLPYLGSALATLIGFKNLDVQITADGTLIETPGVFVQIANAQYMGGGYHFAPMASMDDGLLDVCVVGDFGKLELIREIPGVYKGKHVGHPKFTHLTAKCIEITTSEPAMVQLDGELVGHSPVTFRVLPAAISLVK
jgi:YegS/Rv2252/BmrU family lipid kinase